MALHGRIWETDTKLGRDSLTVQVSSSVETVHQPWLSCQSVTLHSATCSFNFESFQVNSQPFRGQIRNLRNGHGCPRTARFVRLAKSAFLNRVVRPGLHSCRGPVDTFSFQNCSNTITSARKSTCYLDEQYFCTIMTFNTAHVVSWEKCDCSTTHTRTCRDPIRQKKRWKTYGLDGEFPRCTKSRCKIRSDRRR